MKILMLDDDPFALKLLAAQLANLGFRETLARERGADAIRLLETEGEGIGLVFCDLQMPQMDGVEFVRRLARIGFAGGLVLISGEDKRILGTAEKLAKAHRLNVLGALHKPVSPEQLKQILSKHPSPSAATGGPRKRYPPEELRRAIMDGMLVNYYQPKVHVASGVVAGVETLVRWRHPEDGLVFPDQFIATAEEHGLIDDLTRVVLIDALHQGRIWQDVGLNMHVAVNVSMDNLGSLGFPDLVVHELDKAGLHPENLVLEVTESRLMKDHLSALDVLTRLRLKRISLSIDDFGTGHSSLAQLRDIPFDELKVDRSFVHGACRDSSLRAIFEASQGMARELGMRMVSEGVEDRDDWNFLRATGGDMAQGYFIAKPMPASVFNTWYVKWEGYRNELVAQSPT